FGLPYKIVLSTMPEDHIGTREDWEKAEANLADAITSMGKTYEINPGDGAFYGPKLDFHVTDSLGRTWQCGTIQLDYQLPGRFGIDYVDSNSEKQTPVMIHRVVFGSIERFIGVITEHFAGAFPTWLAPVQVKILPVTDRAIPYAESVSQMLESSGFRTEIDRRNEKLGRKIVDGRAEKIPYLLVVGDKDVQNNTVAPRSRSEGDLGTMNITEFTELLRKKVASKALK
ncbi:MAG: threonine--tRNA ligase, partial [Firmicutes bacterium]|nr:threonine--tRNA ligase [Bacillota bacterium]